MTIHEKATELVNTWLKQTMHKPFTLAVARLGILIAEALDDTDQAAYERGLADAGQPSAPPEPTEGPQLADLAQFAQTLGAQGVWLIRGASNTDLIFNLPDGDLATILNIADAPLIFLARFPENDGKEAGIEHH